MEVCAPGHPAKVAKETLRDPQLPGVILDIHKGIHNDCQEKVQQSEEDNQPQTQHTSKHIKTHRKGTKRNKNIQVQNDTANSISAVSDFYNLLHIIMIHYASPHATQFNMFESQQHE